MLYYTLVGQQGPANSVPLSSVARGFHSTGLRPSAGSGIYRVSVAYDVTVCRHTEATVTLHSGVQVTRHNLCVRETAHVDMHVHLRVCVHTGIHVRHSMSAPQIYPCLYVHVSIRICTLYVTVAHFCL